MGLYDDDDQAVKESASYREARERCLALSAWERGAAALDPLAGAVEALDALAEERPYLRGDAEFASWRSTCVAVGRALRDGAAADADLRRRWDAFVSSRPGFAELLDRKDGFARFEMSLGRGGFAFSHPEAWGVEPDEGAGSVLVAPDLAGPESFSVISKALPAVPSMERFAALAVDELRRELPGCNLLERAFGRLGQVDSYDVRFAFTRGGTPHRGRQVLAVSGNTSFKLTWVAPEESHARHEAAVDEMIASFEPRS